MSRQRWTKFQRGSWTTMAVVVATAIISAMSWYPGSLNESQAAVGAVSPFHGTYLGGFWGTYTDGPDKVPYGGAIKATVSQAGAVNVTLPGPGTGTVASNGVFNVTGSLKVNGINIPVTFKGGMEIVTSGSKSIAIGYGTWSAPTVGGTGSWQVRRALLTP